MSQEFRTFTLKELRISTLEDGVKTIEGHAAVFDMWSETLGGIFPFKEKVNRSAFTKTIASDDIRALFNHDANYVLGRNTSRTLMLSEDEKGLKVSIKPPNTQWARDLQESINRGDISQMSFGFECLKDSWYIENGEDVRELIDLKLYDVAVVTFPAYTQTDVGVRSIESYKAFKNKKNVDKILKDMEDM